MEGSRPAPKRWSRYLYRVIAAEASHLTRYYDRVIQWAPAEHDPGLLLAAIDAPAKSAAPDLDALPDLSGERDRRTVLLLNGNFNYLLDIQGELARLKPKLS